MAWGTSQQFAKPHPLDVPLRRDHGDALLAEGDLGSCWTMFSHLGGQAKYSRVGIPWGYVKLWSEAKALMETPGIRRCFHLPRKAASWGESQVKRETLKPARSKRQNCLNPLESTSHWYVSYMLCQEFWDICLVGFAFWFVHIAFYAFWNGNVYSVSLYIRYM